MARVKRRGSRIDHRAGREALAFGTLQANEKKRRSVVGSTTTIFTSASRISHQVTSEGEKSGSSASAASRRSSIVTCQRGMQPALVTLGDAINELRRVPALVCAIAKLAVGGGKLRSASPMPFSERSGSG